MEIIPESLSIDQNDADQLIYQKINFLKKRLCYAKS